MRLLPELNQSEIREKLPGLTRVIRIVIERSLRMSHSNGMLGLQGKDIPGRTHGLKSGPYFRFIRIGRTHERLRSTFKVFPDSYVSRQLYEKLTQVLFFWIRHPGELRKASARSVCFTCQLRRIKENLLRPKGPITQQRFRLRARQRCGFHSAAQQ